MAQQHGAAQPFAVVMQLQRGAGARFEAQRDEALLESFRLAFLPILIISFYRRFATNAGRSRCRLPDAWATLDADAFI